MGYLLERRPLQPARDDRAYHLPHVIRRLDEIQTLEEAKAADISGHQMRRIFPDGEYRPAGSAKETVPGESLR